MQDENKAGRILSRTEKLFAVFALAIIGAIVGLIVRITNGPVTIIPISELMIDIGPFMLIGAVIGILFAHKFPRVASVVVCFVPMGCEVS